MSLTNCISAKKQEALLAEWVEGVFQPCNVWVMNSLVFIEHFSWRFFQLPLKFLCIVFFWEMRCVQFLHLTTTFGDLPTSLGFEWGLCPILLSFKFIFNMFLCFPCPLGTPFWLLKVCCLEWKFSRQAIMLQALFGPLTEGVIREGRRCLGICKAGCFGTCCPQPSLRC